MSRVIAITTLSGFLLFPFSGTSPAQNIVKNGDFESTTGNYVEYGDTLPYEWGLSPTDSVSLSNCGVSNAVNPAIDLGPESGAQYMSFQSRESDGSQDCLYQQLPTVAGQKYLITFSVAVTGGPINSTSFLDPEWDQGGTNDTFLRNSYYYPTSTTVGPVPYKTFTFTETASKSSTTFYFHGVDASGSASGGSILVDNFSVVALTAPAFTSAAPPTTGTLGTPYNFTMTASGTPAPTFTVPANTLPPGLALTSAGVISGTPTQTGVFTGTVTASNTVSPAATQNFSITIGSTYSNWVSQYGLTGNQALQTAIVSPDGLTNLTKYALGLDPFTTYNPGSAGLPEVKIQNISGTNYLTLTFTGAATDVTYTVQGSSDLTGAWSSDYTYKGVPAPGTITVQDSQPIPTTNPTERFMRLLVSP
jgi:hypothetical protein